MYKTQVLRTIAVFLFIMFVISNSYSQDNRPLQSWLEKKIATNIAAKNDQRVPSKQTTTSSMSTNTVSIVDKATVADLIGLTVIPKGTTSSSTNVSLPTSVNVTISSYALYSAIAGKDPLDPNFYNADTSHNFRRFSVILGFDDNDIKTKRNGGQVKRQSTIIGAKYLIIDKRRSSSQTNMQILTKELQNLGVASGNLNRLMEEILFATDFSMKQIDDLLKDVDDSLKDKGAQTLTEGEKKELVAQLKTTNQDLKSKRIKIEPTTKTIFDSDVSNPINVKRKILQSIFRNKILEVQTEFDKLEKGLTEVEKNFIDEVIATNITPFVEFVGTLTESIYNIRKRPQLSIQFLTKVRDKGADEYSGKAIFEYGLYKRLNFTANGSFDYINRSKLGADSRGGSVGIDFEFQTRPDKLSGVLPLKFNVSAESKFMSAMDPIYRTQAKITIPIPKIEGAEIPISITVSNRTDQIKERVVSGQFGFSFDLAKLGSLFTQAK